MKPSVLVTRRVPSVVLARLEPFCETDLHAGETPIAPEELLARVRGKEGLVCVLTDKIDRAVIDAGSDLRVIANIAVGFDNIDVRYARDRQIAVTNTPDVLTESVAEFTWGLILAVSRRISEGERLLRAGNWRGWALDFLLGMELRGKQLGIVGAGRIGRAVAARAPAFGMRVAYGPDPNWQPFKTNGEEAVQLPFDQLLSTSDIVSLHAPLLPETRHLIDRRALLRMKRSAYLVNTARGPLIDEDALAWALRERLIAGAALDVYEREPAVHPDLLGLENIVLAPHLASATTETRTAMADLAASNVLAVLAGQQPLTPVALV